MLRALHTRAPPIDTSGPTMPVLRVAGVRSSQSLTSHKHMHAVHIGDRSIKVGDMISSCDVLLNAQVSL